MEPRTSYRPAKSLLALMAIAASCPQVYAGSGAYVSGASSATSGNPSYASYRGESDIARRARARREEKTNEAMDYLEKGRQLYAKGKYEEALQEFNRANATLPHAPVTEERRAFITEHISICSVALAGEYRKTGRYDEAQKLLAEAQRLDPNNKLVQVELEYLNDPIRTNPALTPQYIEDVKQVNKLLRMGNGFYLLGKYDDAQKQFDSVLRIDPYNVAARRFQERINKTKMDYYNAAYDTTRSAMLLEVAKAWEQEVPSDAPIIENRPTSNDRPDIGSAAILSKLRNIRVNVNFEETTLEEAVDFLRSRSRSLDTSTAGEKGINFIIRSAPSVAGAASTGDIGKLKITQLRLSEVPMLEVLKFITEQLGLRYKVDNYAVVIIPGGAGADSADIVTRSFTVPPNFQTQLEAASGGSADAGAATAPADPFATTGGGGGGAGIKPRQPIDELLKRMGVAFPEGSSCSYLPSSSSLVVRNTPNNLDVIEQIIEKMRSDVPKQVNIATKFVEVTQENTEELSFDWILGPSSLGGGSFLGGGTNGNAFPPRVGSDFANGLLPNGLIPNSTVDPTTGNVTAGNRTGDGAISRDSITALINNPNRANQTARSAPGILSFTGIYDDAIFQVMMRGLNQKKGADLLTAPSITARSGEKATIEIIREFIYPTEYEPPEIPNNVGNGNNNNGGGGGILPGQVQQPQAFPVTPATPTAFETRNTGVTLEVEPTIAADNSTIDLKFAPEIVEFEGFVNYGSPIQVPAVNGLGQLTTLTITENRIEMPVFSTRRVNTGITIYDGYTVAIGGMIKEDVQKVEDKVPILGDIPGVGRLFRSEADNHVKSNLIIFVTGKIIDATGRSIKKLDSPDITTAVEPSAPGGADAGLLPSL